MRRCILQRDPTCMGDACRDRIVERQSAHPKELLALSCVAGGIGCVDLHMSRPKLRGSVNQFAGKRYVWAGSRREPGV